MRHADSKQLRLFYEEALPTSQTTYFIIISPPQRIRELISLLKKELNQQISLSAINLKSIAHISLLKFNMVSNDEQIINKIRQAVSSFHSFDIELGGYMIFKHGQISSSLVINIPHPFPVLLLQQLLATSLKLRLRGKLTPHLTVARAVPSNDFGKIELSAFDYYDSFRCQQVVILKKEEGDDHYKLLAEIKLKGE
jgi:2'-5' RNA ligase